MTKLNEHIAIKLAENLIRMNGRDKRKAFFRQNDPNTLIEIAKYVQKKETLKKINIDDLTKWLDVDFELRIVAFLFIRKIEDKLTGTLIHDLAAGNEDFHLHKENFKSEKMSGHNTEKYIEKFKDFLNILNKGKNKKFSSFLSTATLGIKINIQKFSTEEHQTHLCKRFYLGDNKSQSSFLNQFLFNLKLLRNQVAHHQPILSFKANIFSKNFGVEDFLSIASFFVTKKEWDSAKLISPKAFEAFKLKQKTKSEILSLIPS